jgi:hypothetical protein
MDSTLFLALMALKEKRQYFCQQKNQIQGEEIKMISSPMKTLGQYL